MKNIFWIGDGMAYARPLTGARKRQQLNALKLMGVIYYYDY